MTSTVVFVNGGTGFIGRALCSAFLKLSCNRDSVGHTKQPGSEGDTLGNESLHVADPERQHAYQLYVQTRMPSHHRHRAITFVSSYEDLPDDVIPDVIVNLAGAPIAEKRWSEGRKKTLLDSRIRLTESLFRAIKAKNHHPSVLINASAIGYYGFTTQQACLESGALGEGFAAELCSQWETAAKLFSELGTRVCVFRIGVVLGPGGGALGKLLPVFRMALGGPIATGEQWFSWVHICDLVHLMIEAVHNSEYHGAINATAPNPVPQAIFAQALGKALKRPAKLHTPGFILKLIYGQMAEELLIGGQKVVPAKASNLGFEFEYDNIDAALADITQV